MRTTNNYNSFTISFFKLFTERFSDIAEIHIVTFRDKKHKFFTIKELEEYGIKYDFLEFTDNKKDYIVEKGITIYFDDMDEFIIDLPKEVTVFKIREEGNFDYDEKKWFYDNKTGRKLSMFGDVE